MPAAGVSALTFRSGAYAVAVGLSILPTAAIGPAVVKVESTSVDLRAIRRHGGGTGRARLRRTYATCLRQLSAPRHPIWRPGRLLAGLLLHLSRLSQALPFNNFQSPWPVYRSFVFVSITIVIAVFSIVLLEHSQRCPRVPRFGYRSILFAAASSRPPSLGLYNNTVESGVDLPQRILIVDVVARNMTKHERTYIYVNEILSQLRRSRWRVNSRITNSSPNSQGLPVIATQPAKEKPDVRKESVSLAGPGLILVRLRGTKHASANLHLSIASAKRFSFTSGAEKLHVRMVAITLLRLWNRYIFFNTCYPFSLVRIFDHIKSPPPRDNVPGHLAMLPFRSVSFSLTYAHTHTHAYKRRARARTHAATHAHAHTHTHAHIYTHLYTCTCTRA